LKFSGLWGVGYSLPERFARTEGAFGV